MMKSIIKNRINSNKTKIFNLILIQQKKLMNKCNKQDLIKIEHFLILKIDL